MRVESTTETGFTIEQDKSKERYNEHSLFESQC